jgi:RimJ/RimL family protein N-acetyltransferase
MKITNKDNSEFSGSNTLSNEALPLTLSANGVTLRPVVIREDFPTLFRFRTDPQYLHLWHLNPYIPTYEKYAAQMEQMIDTFFDAFMMVEANNADSPIGFVYSYDMNRTNGYAFACTFVTSSTRGKGAIATVLFMDYLFKTIPMRKIYVDVLAYNHLSLKTCLNGGFIKEGCFKQHHWFGDRYWDMYRLALYRDAFTALKKRVIRA